MTQPQPTPTSEQIAAQLAAIFILIEQELLAGAAAILRAVTPDLEGRQAAVGMLRRLVQRLTARLTARTSPLITAMVEAAITEGRGSAEAAVSRALERIGASGGSNVPPPPPGSALALPDGDDPFDLSATHGSVAAQAIRDDLVSSLDDVTRRLTRFPDDIYKAIAPHGAIYQVEVNDITPAQAQAMAWRVFVSQGVRGFTDRSGREWTLSAYTEMAVRTAAARAHNTSHLARMKALGVEYFSVPNTGHPCPLCFPWQFKVLTDGPVVDPAIPVDATIAEAVAAGLFHPNCRHVLLPVFPGYTVLPEPQPWTAEEERLYRLSQRQRRLELEVRKAKRQYEYALDPERRAEAHARIRRAQSRIREFINATGFLRDSRREQRDLSDPYIKLPEPIRSSGNPPRPPAPPRRPPAGDAPDPQDRDAWLRYWRSRQDDLDLDFAGERIEPHEVEFYEGFLAAGNQVRPIPRDPSRPTSDFVWLNRDDLEVEVKTILTEDFTARTIIRRIRDAVKRADRAGETKATFMVDLRDRPLTLNLRAALAAYNVDNPHAPIAVLFVFSRGRVEQIPLT